MAIKLFSKLLIETCGSCNRKCSTCMRQNDIRAKNRVENVKLSTSTVTQILGQAKQLNFKGPVGFHWFNEPLLDERVPSFIRQAKLGGFYIYLITNGDLLTPELARTLDEHLDLIWISLYEDTAAKTRYFSRLFSKTKVKFAGSHLTTHFSPRTDLQEHIVKYRDKLCWNPQNRMIITCMGEMALCCEDLMCNWKLGNIADASLAQLWFSDQHQKIVETLSKPGGRQAYHYCKICPRNGSFE